MVVGSILFSLSSSSVACAFAFAASVGDVAVLKGTNDVIADVWMASFAMGFSFWKSVLGEGGVVRKAAA